MPKSNRTRTRTRTSTAHNPRHGRRPRTENDDPTGSPRGSEEPASGTGTNGTGGGAQMPEISEGMTRPELYVAARQLQALVNDAQQTRQEQARDALADVTNASAPTEEDAEEADGSEFIKSQGKQFVATRMLWLPMDNEDAVFDAQEDPTYNPLDRFSGEQPKNKIQGALRDLHALIPEEYRDPDEFSGWVKTKFEWAMSYQKSTTATRLRSHPGLVNQTAADFVSSERRLELFFKHIGGKMNNDGKTYYDPSDAPILFADYDEDATELDLDKFLLNENLFWVHSAITLGPNVTLAAKYNQPLPRCRSIAKVWALKKTTPGMIAAAAVWLRWLHSADNTFTPIGDVTAINWERDFECYLEYLSTGLQEQKECVLKVFRAWDDHFYPNSDESMAGGSGGNAPEVEASRNGLMAALRAQE